MKQLQPKPMQKMSRQRGFSLIELLVGIVISLFVVSAASYIFLNTRNSERATNEAASMDETAQYVMTVIGRNVQNARFYPAISSEAKTITNANFIQPYVNIKTTVVGGITTTFAAYDYGIFGCDNKYFDHVTHTCQAWPNATYKNVDSLVIAYYTNDNLQPKSSGSSPLDIGQRADCTRSDSANDPVNTNRVNTVTAAITPTKPLFVSNAFTTRPSKTLGNGDQVVDTLSLICSGNGSVGAATGFAINGAIPQPLIDGLQDLQFTYGTALGATSTTAERYYNATEISNLPPLTIDDTSTGGTKTLSSWGLVKTVKVCIVAKTLNNRVSAQTGIARSYVDCSDATVTIPATDGSLYKRYIQTFGIRNNLNLGAILPS
jgi:type IV pilus assembly protein PilW